MKALVGVKRVLDYAIKVRVNQQKTGVELKGLKMSINPFDEIAVEEAVRLKEKGLVEKVVALSIGEKQAVDTIRHALALGADEGVHILTDKRIDLDLEPLAVAKILAKIVQEQQYDITLLGKQSIDDDSNQTGQMLGSLLNIPVGSFSSEIALEGKSASVLREVDFGLQKVQLDLPAVFTCDLRLNVPRFANVKSILAAKKKKIETIKLEDLGIDVNSRLNIEKVEAPSERSGGVVVESVDELLEKLRNEAKVI